MTTPLPGRAPRRAGREVEQAHALGPRAVHRLVRLPPVDAVAAGLGRTVDDWPLHEVCGPFRLAGIAQRIYYRYVNGLTTKPAVQHIGVLVGYLDERCRRTAGVA